MYESEVGRGITIKGNTSVVSAKRGLYGIHHDVDSWGPMWLFRDAEGLCALVSGAGHEEAWGKAIDILPTIPESDVPEAYGCRDHAELALIIESGEPHPELAEGYHYQGSAEGTGIVSISLSGESLDLVDRDLMMRNRLDIQIRRDTD